MTDSQPDELKTEAVSIKKTLTRSIVHLCVYGVKYGPYCMVINKILYNNHFTSYTEYV